MCRFDIDCNNRSYVCLDNSCVTKSLFDKTNINDICFLILVMILMMLGSVGGLACGSLLIPMIIIALKFNHIDSASTVVSIELFALLSKFILAVWISHPSANKPVIDWSFIAFI